MSTDTRLQDLSELVEQTWKSTEKFVKQFLPEYAHSSPERIQITRAESRSDYLRTQNILELPDDVLNDRYLLQGLIAREYIARSLPPVIPPEIQTTIADSVTVFFLKGQARRTWLEQLGHGECPKILLLEPIGGQRHELWQIDLLSETIKEILELVKRGVSIGSRECHRIVEEARRRATPVLSRDEIGLLRRLIAFNSQSFSDIAEDMGKSIQWVSKIVKELTVLDIIKKQIEINLHRIGFREYALLVKVHKPSGIAKVETICRKAPFVRSIGECITGAWNLIVMLQVPDARGNIETIHAMIDDIESLGAITELHETVIQGRSSSMTFYSEEEGQWKIPWDLAGVHLRKIHRESLAGIIPQSLEELVATDKKISGLELQVLQKITEGTTRLVDIRRELQLGQEKVSRAYRLLKDEKIVVERFVLSNIGLYESAVVITKQEDMGDAISAWAQTLPDTRLRRWIRRGLFMHLNLPQGGSQGLFEAIRRLSNTIFASTVFTRFNAPVKIPVESWDQDTQHWQSTVQYNG